MKHNLSATLALLFFLCLAAGCKKGYREYSFEYKPEYSIPYKVPEIDKGINLENWLSDYADPSEYGTRFSKSYLVAIKAMGFQSVRIPIGSKVLFNANDPSLLNTSNLPYVDSAVSWAIEAGLSVQLDAMHEVLDHSIEQRLKADPVFYYKFPLYYRALAGYFKKYPASKLFFETFNEPNFGNTANPFTFAYYWNPIQAMIISEIRKETREHTIIVTGLYSSFDGAQKMTLYDDAHVVYNIHFYEPLVFTYQGAWWAGWSYLVNGRNIPYPSTPENMQPFVNAAVSQNDKYYLSQYGAQRFNAFKLDQLVREMAAWAYNKRISIVVNEFGVYKPYAPAQDRLLYIADLRKAFEKYHISWSMWELDDAFGLVEYPNGDRTNLSVDQGMLTALGLQ